jgi:hypothetical protein
MNNVIDKNYEDLANGIILQAVHDYRSLLSGFPPTGDVNIDECERFFMSDWFEILTKVDGEMLMNKIRKEFTK